MNTSRKNCSHNVFDLHFTIGKDVMCHACGQKFTDKVALMSACNQIKTIEAELESIRDFLVAELDMSTCTFCEKPFVQKRGAWIAGSPVCPKCYEVAWMHIQEDEDFIDGDNTQNAAEQLLTVCSPSLAKQIIKAYPKLEVQS